MHPSSFDKMKEFCHDYLESRGNEPLTIVDLGSHDINGSYRSLFVHSRWHYIGVDLASGKNVDVVLRNPYDWRELSSDFADVVISGQTFEHTEFFWETMLEIARVLKPRGLCCIIAPSSGPEHRFPLDCWRIFPDGLRAIARYAGLEIVETRTQWEDLPEYDFESNKWHDAVLIARKPIERASTKLRRRVHRWLKRYLSLSTMRAENHHLNFLHS
jgi:SAM-dependent methyltransferase